ncbi:amidohydrolase [Streptomyces pseudoechinosporeus]
MPFTNADTVLAGATVRTLDPRHPLATAVAVRDGRIAAVGEEADVRHWRGPRTQVVDLGGATLTPGLTDGHTHAVKGLELAQGIDLSGCKTLEQLRAALREAARRAAPGSWITGWNLDHNTFEGGPISHHLIDDVVGDIPAFLRLYDAHSALAGSAALRAAGVDGPRRFDQGAAIVCDPDGRPTGHLVEQAAMETVAALIPQPSPAERRKHLLALLADMAATGLTGGHVMDLETPDALDLLTAIEDEGVLPLRLRIAPWCQPGAGPDELHRLIALQGRAGRHWRVAGVKLFLDGTVEGGTAWLDHPDCHGAGTESFWPDPAAYTRAVHALDRAGVPTATHAIGDAAVRRVLDTVQALGTPHARHRAEHLETVPDDQIPRFARLGVAASMQPAHATYARADHSDEWSRRLGPERAARAWRCRDLRAAGATLVLGSDWPVAPYDPRWVLAAAQLRRHPGDPGTPPVRPDQALTPLAALEGYTTHAALAAGEEDIAGRIAPGFRADLTAFTLDPLTTGPDELADAPIRLTMSGGHITHRTL